VTSDNEGTNVSAIEAQSSGVPVVSTRVGGMPSVVIESTGLLVEPDDEEGFARALERVLLDDDLRKRLGRRGAERARSDFSLDRLVANVDSLYRRLLALPSGRTATPMATANNSARRNGRQGRRSARIAPETRE
jgi:D-inositol-3-phosphate glycosyltransferase